MMPSRNAWRWLLALSLLAAGSTGNSQPSQTGWMKVHGVKAEKLKTLGGKEFMAGFLFGTDVCQTASGDFVASGYLKAYDQHPVELGLLKVAGDGTLRWLREYGPRDSAPATPAFRSEQFPWAGVSPLAEGGVRAVFENVIMKVLPDGQLDGEPRLYEPYMPGSGEAVGGVSFTSHLALSDGGIAVAGLIQGPARRETAAVVAARIDPSGQVAWAKLLSGLKASDAPKIALGAGPCLVVGSEPAALVALDPVTGARKWSRRLVFEPFTRGLAGHLLSATSMSYRTLAVAPDGDILFGGGYLMVCPEDKGTGALIARLAPDASSVKWTQRLHSAAHGGSTLVNGLVATTDAIFLCGTGWSFQTPEVLANNNALAIKLDAQGNAQWIRSVGKKRMSIARSEYRDESANALITTGDGGMLFVGGTNAFALPDPGFHQVTSWATERYDVLLCRITAGGGITNLAEGRYPALLSSPDPGDAKRVDVCSPPLRVEELAVEPLGLHLRAVSRPTIVMDGDPREPFTTHPDAAAHAPKAEFTLVKPDEHKMMSVVFDGTLASDPDGGAILRRDWSFGDGGSGAAAKPVHRFRSPGIWKTTLTVWDGEGLSGSLARDVMVGAVLSGEGIPPAFCNETTTSYTVEVATGSSEGAGTDAEVHLALYGPADANGVRYASGDFILDSSNSTTRQTDPFERNNLDTFTLSSARSLDSLDQVVLRHANNSGNRPEWQVAGLKVLSADKKSEWLFVADDWLSHDPPDHRTAITLKPEKPYPMGLFFRGELASHQVGVVRGRVAILPASGDKIYLTSLDKDWTLQAWTPTGILVGTQQAPGGGAVRFPYIKETNWGVGIATSEITRPTRYVIKLNQGDRKEETLAWIFPNGWTGYETEALRLAFILPMEGKLDSIFAPVAKTVEVLPKGTGGANFAAIIAYGADAFRIFGASENLELKAYAENRASQYALTVSKQAARLLSQTASQIYGGLAGALTSLLKAQEWAQALPEVIGFSATPEYTDDLLAELGSSAGTYSTEFRQIVELFRVLKLKVEGVIEKANANDAAACRELLADIRLLCVGPNPEGDENATHAVSYKDLGVTKITTSAELCLGALLARELENIKLIRADPNGHDLFKTAFYQDILALQETGLDYGLDPKEATRLAMDFYEPLLWDLYWLAVPFLDLSLYEK